MPDPPASGIVGGDDRTRQWMPELRFGANGWIVIPNCEVTSVAPTNILADAAIPEIVWFELTSDVVLFWVPAAVPVTFTLNVQAAEAARLAPDEPYQECVHFPSHNLRNDLETHRNSRQTSFQECGNRTFEEWWHQVQFMSVVQPPAQIHLQSVVLIRG